VRIKGEFDYGRQTAKIRQANADLHKTRIQAELAADGIILEVKRAYLSVKAAQDELGRAEEASKFARQVLFLTQSNFDIGLAEPKDLIDAISKFLTTRGEYFKAVFDLNVAFAELDQKVDNIPEA
jgi:outer membrane protein TolC